VNGVRGVESCNSRGRSILIPSRSGKDLHFVLTVTKGGFDDYHKYRKYLEELTEATKLKTISKPVQRIAQEIDKLPVKTPEIKKASKPDAVIDYAQIEREINLIYEYINRMINAYELEQKLIQEQDDELVLLMI